MTITKEKGEFVVQCDSGLCTNRLDGFEYFEDATQYARKAGWKSRRNAEGDWENVCPDCP